MDPAQLKARIEQIYQDLDAYTYYQLLKIEQGASPDTIRGAFHRMAMSMHPDRYQNFGDQELRRQMYAIYKRITEGYRVLMSDDSRRAYDEALGQGQRRLLQTDRKRKGPKRTDKDIPLNARKFFQMAQDAERRGDKKNARINYKFALDMAPDHPLIAEKLAAMSED